MEKDMQQRMPICPSMPSPSIVMPRAPQKRDFWLLLGVGALGILFDRVMFLGIAQLYGLFWIAYMALAFAYLHPSFLTQKRQWFALVPAVILCANLFIYSSGELFLSVLAIPALLMLQCCLLVSEKPSFIEYIFGWFVRPFIHIKTFFQMLTTPFTAKKGNVGKVFLGLLIALPLLIVMLLLLSSADAVFASIGRAILERISAEIIVHIVLIFTCAMLFYSFLYSVRDGRRGAHIEAHPPTRPFDPTIVTTLLISLLAVYAVFTFVQFAYLFGGAGLPEDLTYAEYAHRGFTELMAATAINGVLFFLVLRFTRSTALLRTLQMMLVGAMAVMLVSGLMRLLLYIGAYGFTLLRFNVLWFMGFLAICLIIAAVRLFRERMPLAIAISLAFAACLVVTQCMGAENLIARYNIARYELSPSSAALIPSDKETDEYWYHNVDHPLSYLFTLSADAIPALCDYYERSGDIVVGAYLSGMRTRMEDTFQGKPLLTLSEGIAYARLQQVLK